MSRVRMAMVGCGAIAELGHLPGARLADKVEFTVLIDRDEARARALAARFGIAHVATDIAAASDHADAACVALPHHIHRQATELLLERGLHILIEKPLATTLADCDAMLATAARVGRKVGVAMVRRYAPSSRYLKQLVDSGMLGRIERIHIVSGVGDAWAGQSLYMLSARESGGGVLMCNGCHDLDALTWLLGPVDALQCQIDSAFGLEGNCRIDCTMASGATGIIELSRTVTMNNMIRIEGTNGTVVAPLIGAGLSVGPRGGPLSLTGDVDGATFDFPQLMADQLDDFAGAIQDDRAPLADGAAGRDIVALIERCYAGATPMSFPWARPIAMPVAA
ncbi:Gfo/Idh/MocA family oxidoreductase [Sphingomonas sp. RT2P30]|uniref:Gfo/Idh/MocA family protein n=1 Tax=Parasphingomonas halimpatiens TaxID=3096162 RepID=UPI002FCC42F4